MNNPVKKEMRKLSRAELLDIIYEMKKNEVELQSRLDAVQAELEKREIQIEEAGSIADASLALNDVFQAAQRAADDYLQSVKDRCELKIQAAEEKAAQLLKEAEDRCVRMLEATEGYIDDDQGKTDEE